jgi:alanyl-tRNA synthetase
MLLVRDVMYCKPGKARPMAEKFLALARLGKTYGFTMRVMTDVSAERYWTVVAEMEVKSFEDHQKITKQSMEDKQFQEAMKGYHDLVDYGRREIYTIEQ